MEQPYKNEKLEEFNNFIKYRKVAVIGLGVSNAPLLDYLFDKKAKVTVFDEKDINSIPKELLNKLTAYSFDYYFGKGCLENLKNFVMVIRSPSCLPTREELKKEQERGAIITTEIELLMKMCPR